MAGLPREVLRWIQSLDLTWQLKMPKWDLTNGYLIAEIFSWYYPQDVSMHSFNTGTSLDCKQRNWFLLKNFIKKNKLGIPEEIVDGTIHCKEGAATLMVKYMYEILTNRVVNEPHSERSTEFSDTAYQEKLPLHARSTAAMSIKSNLKATEIDADRSIILSQQKTQRIIDDHIVNRRMQRIQDPKRFDIKPTLGERAQRRPPQNEVTESSIYLPEKADSGRQRTSGDHKSGTLLPNWLIWHNRAPFVLETLQECKTTKSPISIPLTAP